MKVAVILKIQLVRSLLLQLRHWSGSTLILALKFSWNHHHHRVLCISWNVVVLNFFPTCRYNNNRQRIYSAQINYSVLSLSLSFFLSLSVYFFQKRILKGAHCARGSRLLDLTCSSQNVKNKIVFFLWSRNLDKARSIHFNSYLLRETKTTRHDLLTDASHVFVFLLNSFDVTI